MSKPVPETDFNLDHLRTTALPPVKTHRWSVHLTIGGRVESAHVTREEADVKALELGGHVRDRSASAGKKRTPPRNIPMPRVSETLGSLHAFQMRDYAAKRQSVRQTSSKHRFERADTRPWGVRGGSSNSFVSVHASREEAEQMAREFGGVVVNRRVQQGIGRSAAARKYER